MFRTMTARYAGTCKRCKAPITPGQTIRYGGPGRTYHLANFCADADDATPARTTTRNVDGWPDLVQDGDDATTPCGDRTTVNGPYCEHPEGHDGPHGNIHESWPAADPTPAPLTFSTIAGATVTTRPNYAGQLSTRIATLNRRQAAPVTSTDYVPF